MSIFKKLVLILNFLKKNINQIGWSLIYLNSKEKNWISYA